ncbi:stage V sporulation protein AA [Anaerotignum sp.]|uniref:stage V sporulation protein AA n=1 Tax=Anaerotignum sp. TaxID=2039241 RepID=UPI002A916A2B|nr:stage V sporulation protein AA [Anaerotignum sp.]MCI7656597.1 stage V sporulation protein AA [Clostridia bacterium]MDY5414620.1 stage V sporulation protein AA [Anaerotignum sp.]
MDIYIKPMQKAQITGRRIVYLSDVAEIYTGDACLGELEKLPVFQIPEAAENMYLLSVLELVQAITALYPKATVSNVGESDILLSYTPQPKKEKKLILWGKILFVSAVLFCGAATTIMCFHSDAQLPLIFQNYYAMAYGESQELPKLVTIPYSIGLVVGILVFFNHFSKFALSKDPTPIEVEMTTYENETITSIIEQLDRKKRRRKP